MLRPATTPVRHVLLLVLQFHVRYKCEYGQEVYLVGNCSALGDWDVMKGVQLVWSSGHIWEGSVELPAGCVLGCTLHARNIARCIAGAWCLDTATLHGIVLTAVTHGGLCGAATSLLARMQGAWRGQYCHLPSVSWQQSTLAESCSDACNMIGSCSQHFCMCCHCVGRCSMHIQYKYVVRNKDGSVVRWQEGANVSLELPGGNADELALDVEDSWNKSKQVRQPQQQQRFRHGPYMSGTWALWGCCWLT